MRHFWFPEDFKAPRWVGWLSSLVSVMAVAWIVAVVSRLSAWDFDSIPTLVWALPAVWIGPRVGDWAFAYVTHHDTRRGRWTAGGQALGTLLALFLVPWLVLQANNFRMTEPPQRVAISIPAGWLPYQGTGYSAARSPSWDQTMHYQTTLAEVGKSLSDQGVSSGVRKGLTENPGVKENPGMKLTYDYLFIGPDPQDVSTTISTTGCSSGSGWSQQRYVTQHQKFLQQLGLQGRVTDAPVGWTNIEVTGVQAGVTQQHAGTLLPNGCAITFVLSARTTDQVALRAFRQFLATVDAGPK